MKRTTLIAALAGFALVGVGLAQPALATQTPKPVCGMPAGFYGNPDEQDRLPAPGPYGLTFTGNDLIHHGADTTVEALTHGSFVAAPAPDQNSFFSVEVMGSDGGYGTLRWNTDTSKWNLTTGGQFYENVSAIALVDMPPVHRSHHVISFGVGYTNTPPGTVATTVSQVTFAGHTYKLGCAVVAHPTPTRPHHPTHTPTVKPTATPTATATTKPPTVKPTTKPTVPPTTPAQPTPGESTTPPIVGVTTGNDLPLTGPSGVPLIIGGGAGLILFGFGLLVLVRRKRFTA